MRTLAAALILALGACKFTPAADDRPIAGAVSGQTTSSTPAGELVRPTDKNIPVTQPGGSSSSTPANTTPTVPAPAVDPTRRFEYAEVTVNLGDPVGMRALVPYLLKPETWTLVKCEMVSTTSKYYKFQKVTSNDGRSLPDVDIFKSRR